jgi:hypothetical protein
MVQWLKNNFTIFSRIVKALKTSIEATEKNNTYRIIEIISLAVKQTCNINASNLNEQTFLLDKNLSTQMPKMNTREVFVQIMIVIQTLNRINKEIGLFS